MGNDYPLASIIGEVIPASEWYSFENKYVDADGAKCQIPAEVDEITMKRLQETAVESYRLLECAGLTRVDMFLLEDDRIVVNEVNNLPGFTSISMYPQLWEASGVGYTELITKLIHYAIESHRETSALKNQ